jgi:hypothetical protein
MQFIEGNQINIAETILSDKRKEFQMLYMNSFFDKDSSILTGTKNKTAWDIPSLMYRHNIDVQSPCRIYDYSAAVKCPTTTAVSTQTLPHCGVYENDTIEASSASGRVILRPSEDFRCVENGLVSLLSNSNISQPARFSLLTPDKGEGIVLIVPGASDIDQLLIVNMLATAIRTFMASKKPEVHVPVRSLEIATPKKPARPLNAILEDLNKTETTD